ncbi:MAG: hypothetical protein ACYCWW_02330 [Deltaproteobacteria bacterium]
MSARSNAWAALPLSMVAAFPAVAIGGVSPSQVPATFLERRSELGSEVAQIDTQARTLQVRLDVLLPSGPSGLPEAHEVALQLTTLAHHRQQLEVALRALDEEEASWIGREIDRWFAASDSSTAPASVTRLIELERRLRELQPIDRRGPSNLELGLLREAPEGARAKGLRQAALETLLERVTSEQRRLAATLTHELEVARFLQRLSAAGMERRRMVGEVDGLSDRMEEIEARQEAAALIQESQEISRELARRRVLSHRLDAELEATRRDGGEMR